MVLKKEAVPQIPWAKHVKVTKMHVYYETDGIGTVDMELPGIKAEVSAYGDVSLHIQSRKNISSSMGKSDELTRSLRRYSREREAALDYRDFHEAVEDWLIGRPFLADHKPWGTKTPGVMDWWPELEQKVWPKIGKIGHYKTGLTDDVSEDWIGTRFSFVHIEMKDDEEGLVILWPGQASPEVWLGSVDGFISNNVAGLYDSETFAAYNDVFENGFLWALDYMGAFEGKKAREIPEWVIETLYKYPDLMWRDLVEKLLSRLTSLPVELEEAILTWEERRRTEAEKAAGQKYLWPRDARQGEESGEETT